MIKINKSYGESVYLNPSEVSSFYDVRGIDGPTTYVTMKNGTEYRLDMSASVFSVLVDGS